ncbi:MAG: S9 family peptidase, partial [Microcoleus sp. SIO2G3]|nr:S9 family peptidase [Microcoleus sp. SIO2G3]
MTEFDLDWQSPPDPIAKILDAPPPPALMLSPDRQWVIELEQPSLPSIAELAEPEVAIAGFRINPNTNTPARHGTFRSMKLGRFEQFQPQPVDLPDDARISYFRWSPDDRHLAFMLTQPN